MCIMLTLALNFSQLFYFGDFWNTGIEHCNVAWLVSIALTQALSFCTICCLFHDGVIVSGVEGEKNCMLKATLIRNMLFLFIYPILLYT